VVAGVHSQAVNRPKAIKGINSFFMFNVFVSTKVLIGGFLQGFLRELSKYFIVEMAAPKYFGSAILIGENRCSVSALP